MKLRVEGGDSDVLGTYLTLPIHLAITQHLNQVGEWHHLVSNRGEKRLPHMEEVVVSNYILQIQLAAELVEGLITELLELKNASEEKLSILPELEEEQEAAPPPENSILLLLLHHGVVHFYYLPHDNFFIFKAKPREPGTHLMINLVFSWILHAGLPVSQPQQDQRGEDLVVEVTLTYSHWVNSTYLENYLLQDGDIFLMF